jgi:hypothetical protein
MTSCTVCATEGRPTEGPRLIRRDRHPVWKNLASWNEVEEGEAAKDLVLDVKNFTDVSPVMLAGEVVDWLRHISNR